MGNYEHYLLNNYSQEELSPKGKYSVISCRILHVTLLHLTYLSIWIKTRGIAYDFFF